MRLLSRVSLQLLLSSALLITLHIAFIRWWQVEQLEHVAGRELRLLGGSVQTAFESAIRHQDPQEMRELFAHIERVSSSMDMVLFDERGQILLHSEQRDHADARFARLLADPQRDQEQGVVRFYHDHSPCDALVLMPVVDAAQAPRRYLGIYMPMEELKAEIGAINHAGAWLLSVLLMLNILAGVLIGRGYVVAPLNDLAEALERIRQGDLSVQLAVSRQDEIGTLLSLVNELSVELGRSRAELNAQMQERQLLLMALRHRDRLASVGQLAAGIAHEIGSPLQVLLGRAQSLSRHRHDPDKIEHIASIISTQIERIGRIVERMLSFAKPHEGQLRAASPIPSVVQVIELLGPELARARQRLDHVVTPEAAAARCFVDPDGIQQIAFNLITNASQWTPPEGLIHVGCSLEPWPDSPHRASPSPHQAKGFCLSVTDEGQGMTQDALERVYELFFTLRHEQGGSGLGLPIVKTLVHHHHGHIDIASTPGQGTCVKVWLPLAPFADAETAP